jgi:predicted permease
MTLLHRLASIVRWLLHRDRAEQDLHDEVQAFVDMAAADKVRNGARPTEARRLAILDLGGIEQTKERVRTYRHGALLDEIGRDVRYAIRTLGKSRAFTATATVTLALAIGANTAMFSVINAVLLRPLPYRSPEQLAMLWIGRTGPNQGRPAYLTVEEWRRQSKSFADLAVLDPAAVTLTDTDGAERIMVARVSPNFFPMLGVLPMQGHTFSDEDADQRRRVALISYRFWQTRFGGSPVAIGATIVLDGLPSQIIGILPEAFATPAFDADVWEPHTMFPDWEARRATRGVGSWIVIGRLRPNVTVAQAQSEMNPIARVLDQQLPVGERNRGVSVVPVEQYLVVPRSRLALWMLTGAVLCVLLIAAANVASLSMARIVSRAREIAIRATLGASPARIVRQLLAESVTLAAISGLVGTFLAVAGIRVIRALGPGDLARLNEVSLDVRVLGVALLVSLLAGVLVGLAPAFAMVRRNSQVFIEQGVRSVSGSRAARGTGRTLVVAEFALAMILLTGAGLLVRSWLFLDRVDPGFSPDGILSLQVSTTAFRSPSQRTSFYESVHEQIASLPGVESVGIIGDLFISNDAERLVTIDGSAGFSSERVRLRVDEANGGFFTTLRTPLLRGRLFSVDDRPDSPRVAIINEAMARRFWAGRDPVGARFKFGPRESDNEWFTVLGVVSDMHRQGLEREPIPQMFEALAQNPSRLGTILVRTSTHDPLKMAGTIRAAVRRVDSQVPVYGVTSVEDRFGAYLAQRRFQTSLLIGFSIVALLIAAVGIYGLIHYSVATRTQEIGIRRAIGAQTRDIFRLVVHEGLLLSATGLMLGLVGALWVGHIGSSLLFGVSGTDPLTFMTVSLLLTAVAVAACCFPARRAIKVEPTVALRQA